MKVKDSIKKYITTPNILLYVVFILDAVAVYIWIHDDIKTKRLEKIPQYVETEQKLEVANRQRRVANQEYINAQREFWRVRDSLTRAEKAQKSNQK